MEGKAEGLVACAARLAKAVRGMRFVAPVTHVYNPLEYAWDPHRAYLERFGAAPREVLFVGMNPGPWGMVQTGVPFGEVTLVRDWLGISGPVGRPNPEHPKRPVLGFACTRSEVSGARLWGWARDRYGTPDRFFKRYFVHNYCPLAFMEASGRNFTPDKLPVAARTDLFGACDAALRGVVEHLRPRFIIGVGSFAERRIRATCPNFQGGVGRLPHPSPASPAANRGWAEAAEAALHGAGVSL